MKRILIIAALILPLARGNSQESTLTPDELSVVGFEQKLDGQIPFDLVFHEAGRGDPSLGDVFEKRKPAILVLGYDNCPMLCGLVLDGMIGALQEVKLDAGKDFSLISVSIDPTETPEQAAARKSMYLKRYGRRASPGGWHFLTGKEEAIGELAETMGFGYVYDPGINEFAHPSGFIVVTPNGRISRYFFGVAFQPADLNSALRTAAGEEVGSPIKEFLLTCFQYNPLTGKYGPTIMKALRVCAFLVMALIGGYVGRSLLRERRKSALPVDSGNGGSA